VIATLFDFNGVLIDDERVHLAAFREVVRPFGIEIDDAMYAERYLGFDDAGALRAMLTDAGQTPTPEQVARLVEAKKPVYMELVSRPGQLVIFDGARDLVERRARRGPVGIVSGALRHEIEHALGLMGVKGSIAFIVSADDTTECKPHPEGYLLGLRALGLDLAAPPESRAGVVVLEDSIAGVVAAKQAKLRCAAVTHSYPAARLHAAGADVVVTRLEELDDAAFEGET
jgi:beta-phosphoglucomutase-like phosphatase (HAD superfamily)